MEEADAPRGALSPWFSFPARILRALAAYGELIRVGRAMLFLALKALLRCSLPMPGCRRPDPDDDHRPLPAEEDYIVAGDGEPEIM